MFLWRWESLGIAKCNVVLTHLHFLTSRISSIAKNTTSTSIHPIRSHPQREHTNPKQHRWCKQIFRWSPICSLHVPVLPTTWLLPNDSPDVNIVLAHMPSSPHIVSAYVDASMPSRIVSRWCVAHMPRPHIIPTCAHRSTKCPLPRRTHPTANKRTRPFPVCLPPGNQCGAGTYHRDATNMTSFPFHFQFNPKSRAKLVLVRSQLERGSFFDESWNMTQCY